MALTVSRITANRLKSGEFRREFPDYYALAEVTEHGVWHTHQNVFDHVLAVYAALEEQLELPRFSPELVQAASAYLNQKVGNLKRVEVLKVATLLHDIAKTETLIVNANGTANCPGHEHLAAGRVAEYAETFGMNEVDTERVTRIVLHHGFISDILAQIHAKPEKTDYFWQVFTQSVGDVAYELLFLMRADLHGCDLRENDPEKFEVYDKQLHEWLQTKLPNA